VRRLPAAAVLLPIVIALAALALAASELLTTFELTPPGGDPLSGQLGGDRHGYAMLLLAAFALVTLAIAVATGQRVAAWATAGFGIAALALFLIVDLPDAGDIGDVALTDPGGGPPTRLLARGRCRPHPRPRRHRLRHPGRRRTPGPPPPLGIPPRPEGEPDRPRPQAHLTGRAARRRIGLGKRHEGVGPATPSSLTSNVS